MSQKSRPFGVTILAVLEALGGLAYLLGAAAMMALGAFAPMMEVPMFLSAIAGGFGVVLLVFAIISFVLAYGLFTGKAWAWFWSLVFAAIGIVIAIIEAMGSLGSAILPIIIQLIIIYYLTRPHVKAFFGK